MPTKTIEGWFRCLLWSWYKFRYFKLSINHSETNKFTRGYSYLCRINCSPRKWHYSFQYNHIDFDLAFKTAIMKKQAWNSTMGMVTGVLKYQPQKGWVLSKYETRSDGTRYDTFNENCQCFIYYNWDWRLWCGIKLAIKNIDDERAP